MDPEIAKPEPHLNRDWSYEAGPGFYDEMLGPDGARAAALAHADSNRSKQMGHAGFARRWQEGRRLIHDNGITYNVYSDPENARRAPGRSIRCR